MSCTQNFTEWTREQKEELAERRMKEMRLKNELLVKRYIEVEGDRMEAESKNSAITNVLKGLKKENKYEACKTESKIIYAREWDRGKPDKDNWRSPDRRGSFKNYRAGRFEKKDSWNNSSRNEDIDSWHDHHAPGHRDRKDIDRNDTWGNSSRNENADCYRHGRSSEIMQNRKIKGNYRHKQYDDQQHSSRLHKSPKRARGIGYRNNELHKNHQHTYSDEKYKKSDYDRSSSRRKYSYRAHSRSSSRSESEFVGNNVSSMPVTSIRASSLWQNDKISEDQTKQNRVENWVKSVNKSNWGRGKPFPSDQKEKNRGRTKFDRFEHSSTESSSGDFKCRDNNNIIQKTEYHLNKRQNTGAFTYSVGSGFSKQNDRCKGFKSKRSPQNTSSSSSKNDHLRKRRCDNKGFKADEKGQLAKSVIQDNSDTWKIPVTDNRFMKKESPNFNTTDTWAQDNDSWGPAVQSQVNNNDSWQNAEQPEVDDGIWETAEQSDIKWKLSDEETDFKDKKVVVFSTEKNSSGTMQDISSKIKSRGKEKQTAQSEDCNPVVIRACNQQGDPHLKLATAGEKSKATDVSVPEEKDGWEDYESSSNLNEISEKMEKNCKIRDKMGTDKGSVGGKISAAASSTSIVKASIQKQRTYVSPEKSLEKNTGGSDGWSTVSEEGEIHSDEDDSDSEWKKDSVSK